MTDDGEEAKPTAGFQRVIQRAVIHVQSSGRDEVTGANVLVAIFAERESHAAYFLQEQDMTRYDAVNYISHGIAKRPASAKARTVRGAQTRKLVKAKPASEKKNDALEAFCINLNEKAIRRQDRSADRPRRKSSAPSRCCAAARRTIRCSSAIPALARRPSPKAWPNASSMAMCLKFCRCDHFLARHGCPAGRHALSRRFRRTPEAGREGDRGL
jgi:hypothetical protein